MSTPSLESLWMPFTPNRQFKAKPRILAKASGMHYWSGDGRQILRSIHTKLLTLPEDATVIPGHGQNTTIGREKDRNPFLR